MRGYKMFRSDWCATHGNGIFQYKVGETYEIPEQPQCHCRGFHYCKDLKDCFDHYSLDASNRIAEIEALGDIQEETHMCSTNKIKIVREISWADVLQYL